MIEPSSADLAASPETVQAWVSHLLVAVHEFDSDLDNASAKADAQAAEIARLRELIRDVVDEYDDQTTGPTIHSIQAARAALERQP